MMQGYNWSGFGMMNGYENLFPFLLPFVLLELVLKGFALWKAARSNQLYWFLALLVFNTAGILPGIYLLVYSNKFKKA